MKYDDLLNIPFKKFGRDKTGFDCYGVVMECCKRAGTPLRDLYGNIVDLPADSVNDYISGGLNVKEIDATKAALTATAWLWSAARERERPCGTCTAI